jgi:hypothetical protein
MYNKKLINDIMKMNFKYIDNLNTLESQSAFPYFPVNRYAYPARIENEVQRLKYKTKEVEPEDIIKEIKENKPLEKINDIVDDIDPEELEGGMFA